MKRAWFQRIRGGGCQTLVYGGKTHVLLPCVFATFLVLSNLFIACFVSWGVIAEWLLVVEAVIVFGSGVAGLSVPCPHAHSTHDCIHSTLPTLPRLHSPILAVVCSSSSRLVLTFTTMVCSFSPWSLLPHVEVGVVILLHSLLRLPSMVCPLLTLVAYPRA